MTLPYEKDYSLTNVRNVLIALAISDKYAIKLYSNKDVKTIPKWLRQLACRLLKHYPSESEIKRKKPFETLEKGLTMKLIYLAMPYRGKKGNNATEDDIALNLEAVAQMEIDIRKQFPEVKLFVPHTCEPVQRFNEAFNQTIDIDEKAEIADKCLELCTALVEAMPLAGLLSIGGVTHGMAVEIAAAKAKGTPVLAYKEWNDEAREAFAVWLMGGAE